MSTPTKQPVGDTRAAGYVYWGFVAAAIAWLILSVAIPLLQVAVWVGQKLGDLNVVAWCWHCSGTGAALVTVGALLWLGALWFERVSIGVEPGPKGVEVERVAPDPRARLVRRIGIAAAAFGLGILFANLVWGS